MTPLKWQSSLNETFNFQKISRFNWAEESDECVKIAQPCSHRIVSVDIDADEYPEIVLIRELDGIVIRLYKSVASWAWNITSNETNEFMQGFWANKNHGIWLKKNLKFLYTFKISNPILKKSIR